jgi:hypothetical protein
VLNWPSSPGARRIRPVSIGWLVLLGDLRCTVRGAVIRVGGCNGEMEACDNPSELPRARIDRQHGGQLTVMT